MAQQQPPLQQQQEQRAVVPLEARVGGDLQRLPNRQEVVEQQQQQQTLPYQARILRTLFAAPVVWVVMGPDCAFFTGGQQQQNHMLLEGRVRPPRPPGMKRAAQLVSVDCVHCKKTISVDKSEYDPETSPYRICSVTCSSTIAAHRTCAAAWMLEKRQLKYDNHCENCPGVIRDQLKDTAAASSWPTFLNRFVWYGFVHPVFWGMLFVHWVWSLAYLALQFECFQRTNALCLPSRLRLDSAYSLFWSTVNHPYRPYIMMAIYWNVGWFLLGLKRLLFVCCGCCAEGIWASLYGLYWKIRYQPTNKVRAG